MHYWHDEVSMILSLKLGLYEGKMGHSSCNYGSTALYSNKVFGRQFEMEEVVLFYKEKLSSITLYTHSFLFENRQKK